MKIQGTIHGKTVIVMIDNSVSHYFISGTLVSQLQLPVMETPLFGVILRDGHRMQCRGVSLLTGDFSITVDCFLFPLGGVNIKSMEMTFKH